jgi:hypothetical protein
MVTGKSVEELSNLGIFGAALICFIATIALKLAITW